MITLRALEPEDIDILYRAENEMAIWNRGCTNEPYSRELLRQYVLSTTGDIYTDKQVRMVICNDDVPVGLVDLTDFDPKNQRAEVGIMMLPEFRGKGFASEALSLISNYARDIIHLHQIYAIIPSDNPASLALFRSNGFANERLLADWICYGSNYGDAVLMQRFI